MKRTLDTLDDSIVYINAGGIRVTVLKDTLTKAYPESLLAMMFNERHVDTLKRDNEGCFFIDTDGVLFGHIIHYIRRSIPFGIVPLNVHPEIWSREVDYWGLVSKGEEIPSEKDSALYCEASIDQILSKKVDETKERIDETLKILLSLTNAYDQINKGKDTISLYIPVTNDYLLPWGVNIFTYLSHNHSTMISLYPTYTHDKSKEKSFGLYNFSALSKAKSYRKDYIFNNKQYNTVDHSTYELRLKLHVK